ncbi:MAG: protein-(glutamine-N5) methyltransferase, release factor-specific [Flavobacteriaceae bacterium]|nr:protein-(glutamine-N5) methyltransferase, release factor-specific [Flavobacteriaceae bacterium]
MTLAELKATYQKKLTSRYPASEIASFFQLLVEEKLNLSRIETAMQANREISEAELDYFENALSRLLKYEPIQYIIGHTEFYGFPLNVTPATLIPRPETEELVDWVITDTKANVSGCSVLDIGTGSGCIAISLAKHMLNASISALDVSSEALTVAKENARGNNVSIDFFKFDILSANAIPQRYNYIVSNPPYVRESEKNEMQKNVLDFEPASALFVADADALVFYRAIARLAKNHLVVGGALYFEINEYLSEPMLKLMADEGFGKVELRKDFRGKFRMMKATYRE